MVELRVSIDVAAPAETVFAAATDWARQGEWMPGTQLRVRSGTGTAAGDEFVARTALPGRLGWIGFDDPMRITRWASPEVCEVLHLGRIVRGTGAFEVSPLPAGGSRYTWVEWVDPPFGAAGRVGLQLARRPFQAALRLALRRFARWVESGCWASGR